MNSELRYIELKTGYSNNGPAWIGRAEFSKSGQTVYSNAQAFRSIGGSGIAKGNYVDIETGEEYWISGIKKDEQNRHWTGAGKVKIDRKVINDYLKLVHASQLNLSQFEITDLLPIDKQKFNQLDNQKFS